MIAFLLIITLIAPDGSKSLVVEHADNKKACQKALKATVEAMKRDPKGYTLRSIECVPAAGAK